MRNNPHLRFLAAVIVSSLLTVGISTQAQGASKLDSYWTATGKSYPAGVPFKKPMPWAAGQYVVAGVTTNGARKSVAKTLLVRQEQGGWVIEMSAIAENGDQNVTQMLVTGYEQALTTGDKTGLNLVWIKMAKKDGSVTTIQGAQLGMMKGLFASAYENLVSNVSASTDGGAVVVPAGSFAGTSTVKVTTKVMTSTRETQTWLNSAVPLSGMVKSMSVDGKTLVELLSFGFDGVPSMPPGK